MNPAKGPNPGQWVVSYKAVAVVMGVFGLTCLGVLVVVTSLDGKDALSTVALALAILAFSVQLIVFVAQQSLASEQGRRSEELYGSMQGLIAEIREKAAGTQADVRIINEKMLGAILSKNLAPGGTQDYLQVATRAAREAASAGGPQSGDETGGEIIWPERRPSPADEELAKMLETFPAEGEDGDSLDILAELSNLDRISLKAFGEDEITARQPGYPFDPSLPVGLAADLPAKGLVEAYPPDRQPQNGPTIMHLTDRGRDIARLLTARGDPPAHLPGLSALRSDAD
jgi:hypothetical protein